MMSSRVGGSQCAGISQLGEGGVAMQKKVIPTMGLNSKAYFMVILRQLANLKISFIIAGVRILHQLIGQCKQLCKQFPQQETLTGRG